MAYRHVGDSGEGNPDIVRALIDEVMQVVQLTEEQRQRIEARWCETYGGDRFRIPKRRQHMTEERRSHVRAQAITGVKSDKELCAEFGMSRRSLYYWVKRGEPEPK